MSHIHGPMGERLRRRIVAAAFIKLSRFWTKLNEYFERRRGDKKGLRYAAWGNLKLKYAKPGAKTT